MTCKNIEDKISLYLDGELPQSEVSTLMNHIETCKECNALFEDMKLMKELLSDMPQVELPDAFESELHSKLVEASTEMNHESESKVLLEKDNSNVTDINSRKVIKIPLPSWKDFSRHSKPLTAIAATVLIAFLAYGAGSVTDYMPNMMDEAAFESTAEAPAMMTEEAMPEMMFSDDVSFDENSAATVSNFSTSSETQAKAATSRTVNEPAVFGTYSGVDGVEVEAVEIGQAQSYSLTVSGEADLAEEAAPEIATTTTATSSESSAFADNRLIIYTADVWLDIVNYDETYEKLATMVQDMGGYISDANTSFKYYDESNPDKSLKYGRITIRVPQERFMGTVEHLETIGIQKNLNIWSQDITSQYRDIANEVANLEIREAKLREIMEKAEEIEDVISVERELSRVRGEINGYMGTLKDWERLVSLSTIHIELNEVETLEPQIKPIDKTLLQKARDGFVRSINQLKYLAESIFIGSIAFFPKLIVWVILFFIGYKIVKWIRKKVKK